MGIRRAEVYDWTLWQMLDLVTATTNTALNPLSSPTPDHPPPFTHPRTHTHAHAQHLLTPCLWYFGGRWRNSERRAARETKRKREQREAWLPDLFPNPPTFPFHWSRPRQAGGQACLTACMSACLAACLAACLTLSVGLSRPVCPGVALRGCVLLTLCHRCLWVSKSRQRREAKKNPTQ